MGVTNPPPGWYDDYADPDGRRWWDGSRWTDHTQPPPPRALPPPPPTAVAIPAQRDTGDLTPGQRPAYTTPAEPAADRSWWRRKRVLIPSGLGLLIIVGMTVAGDPDPSAVDTSGDRSSPETTATEVAQFVGRPTEKEATAARSEPLVSTTDTSTSTIPTTRTSTSTSEARSLPTAAALVDVSSTTNTSPTTAPPPTEKPTTTPPTTAAPTATAAPTTAANCHPAYSPCLPNHPGDALNCGDLSSGQKPVTVKDVSNDPYGLDGDNDGVGCESG